MTIEYLVFFSIVGLVAIGLVFKLIQYLLLNPASLMTICLFGVLLSAMLIVQNEEYIKELSIVFLINVFMLFVGVGLYRKHER